MNLPESSGAGSCSVDDVLITGELRRRPSRPPDFAAENEALVTLARELTNDPGGVLQKVAEMVVRLCRADSAGISVLERDGDEEIFRWHATAGRFAPNLWGTMPRLASPCGTVITRNNVLLFNEPERFFPALRGIEPYIYENLLAPCEVGGKVAGTVWAIGHSPEHRFDAEDARLLTALARFAGAAYGLIHRTRVAEEFRVERLAALNLMEDALLARRETEQASAALRTSEERYRTLFETMVEGFALCELVRDGEGRAVDWRYLELNPAWEKQTGLSRDEALRSTASRMLPGLEEWWYQAYARVVDTNEAVRFEHYLGPLDRWYQVIAYPMGGQRFAIIYDDITGRKRTEEALRASEERLRLVVESVEDYAIFTMDAEGRILSWNPGAERLFGHTEEEAVGQHTRIIFTPEDQERGVPEAEMRRAREEGRAPDERWHVSRRGVRFYLSGVLTPLRDDRGAVTGYAKVARDLTERQELEEALRHARDEMEDRVWERTSELQETAAELLIEVKERAQAEDRVRALLAQVVTAQEEERRRIARELHDTLGQQLAALRWSIDLLKSKTEGQAEVQEETERMQSIFDRLNSDVDFLAWELRPAALDTLGLDAALRTFVREWSEHFGVSADYRGPGEDSPRLAPETETNLYRILQEALQNVHKHAEADHVSVILERRDGQAVLIVEDNGKGYDADGEEEAGNNKGMGVVNMRERAALLDGELEVESAPGAGTTIFIRVPDGGFNAGGGDA